MVLVIQIGLDQIEHHEVNNKAQNTPFTDLSLPTFNHAFEIWSTLERYHECMSHVKARPIETHRQ